MAMRAGRSGDRTRYELFLREFSESLRRIITHQLNGFGLNAVETEDVVQEVLIAVHSKRSQWDEKRPLIPWLNAITRYKVVDTSRRFRRDSRRRSHLTDEEWGNLFDRDSWQEERPAADVERLVSQLPEGQSDLLPGNYAIGRLARQMETSYAARPFYRGSDHWRAARA